MTDMTRLKLRSIPWLAICVLLVIASVCCGAITRSSYTNYCNDGKLPTDLIYAVAPYSAEEVARMDGAFDGLTVAEMEQRADLIVVGTLNGQREYVHKSFLTGFNIEKVIKGPNLSDCRSIMVFEPVGIYDRPSGKTLVPSGAYMLGGTFMSSGSTYVLFLKRASDSISDAIDADGFVMLNSPYAKLAVDNYPSYKIETDAEYRTPLSEYLDYDVVVADRQSLEIYQSICSDASMLINGKSE